MITQHCKNPDCDKSFPLDADHRFGGYCSAECARAMTPKSTDSVQVFVCKHVGYTSRRFNSKRGTDNRKASNE